MNFLSRVWAQANLSLHTKLRIYNTCMIVSCRFFSTDLRRGPSSQLTPVASRHSICDANVASWASNGRTNSTISERTGLFHISDIISARRTALFGHVSRLGEKVPANRMLRISIDALDQSTLCHLAGNAPVAGQRHLAQTTPELGCPHQRSVGQCSATRSWFAGAIVPRRTRRS